MAQVTERTSKIIKKKIKIQSDEEYQRALSKSVISTFKKLISEIESGIINVYGRPGSGRTLVAKKLMYVLSKREKTLNVTMDSKNGFRYVSKNEVLLVMPGTIETHGKETDHSYVESYQNYAIKRNGIVIIITSDPIKHNYIEYSFETAGEKYDDEDRLIIKTLLNIESKLIGSVKFSEIMNVEVDNRLDNLIENAKKDYLTDEVHEIVNNIDEYTKDLMKLLLVDKKVIFYKSDQLRKRQNDISPEFNIALGPPGSGKSTISEIYLKLDIEKHGKEHVHSMSHKKDLGVLLHRGFSDNKDHYIQWLKVEDATYELQNDSEVFSDWINIRHLMNEATGGNENDKSTGIQQGQIKTWLNLHEFEGQACPKAFRQKVNNLWITDIPTNMHDYHLVKNFLEQGVMFEFLKYTSKKYKEAKKNADTEKMDYWRGWGVVRTAEGLYPYRLHLDDYEAEYFDILEISSQWRETWEDIVIYLIDKFSLQGIDNPSSQMVNAAINKYEMKEYGRLRPQSEKGINYRKAVADNVKAYFQGMGQTNISDDEDDDKNNLKPKKTERKQFDEYDLELIDIEIDKAFLEKMIETIPEMRKAQNIFDGRDGEINDWKRHRSVLFWYLYGSQRDAASVDGVSQTSITKWSKQYKEGGKYNKGRKEYYWGQGYDAEVALEEILEPSWKKGGENKSEPDLYNLEEKKLISLKCISHTSYWDYLDRVGQEELSWVHEKDFDGELWIYILPRQQWRKYKILPKED